MSEWGGIEGRGNGTYGGEILDFKFVTLTTTLNAQTPTHQTHSCHTHANPELPAFCRRGERGYVPGSQVHLKWRAVDSI